MTITAVQQSINDKTVQLVAKQAQITALGTPTSDSQRQLLKQYQEEFVRGCIDARKVSPTSIIATLVSPITAALGTVAITGTGGQFSCAASTPLAVGDTLVLSGTYGGTGSITGYSNPTTYKLGATNGTTTFTLVNGTTGAAIVTTTGTPTGITYGLSLPVFSPAWLATYHPEIAALTAQVTAGVTSGDVQDQLLNARMHAIDDAMAQGITTASAIISACSWNS